MLLALLLVLMTGYFLYSWYQLRFFVVRGIPGPKPWPILGNLADRRSKPWFKMVEQRLKEYGPVYGIFHGLTPRLVITDPDVLKTIMIKDFQYITDRATDRFTHPIVRQMVIMKHGTDWAMWRKAVTPAYSPQKLKAMMPHIDSAMSRLMKDMNKRTEGGEAVVDIKILTTKYAMEVISTTAMGIHTDLGEKENPMTEAIKQFFNPPALNFVIYYLLPQSVRRFIGFTFFNRTALNTAIACCRAVMQERRKQGDQAPADITNALMNIKLGEGDQVRGPTDDEVVANILNMFLAGIDNPAVTMATAVFHLAQDQGAQQRLLCEIKECAGEHGVDYESIKDMKFLDAVVNECLRLYPPSSLTERMVTKEYNFNGAILPVGTEILIPLFNMHRNEKYFPKPHTFDPDRFMGERGKEINEFAYMPFGQGPRICPGIRYTLLETKILVARLMLDYEFLPCPGMDKVDCSQTVNEIMMTSGTIVKFRRRQ